MQTTRIEPARKVTDRDRLDFIDRAGYMSLEVDAKSGEFTLFTVISQHVRGKNIRKLLDTALEFERGERLTVGQRRRMRK